MLFDYFYRPRACDEVFFISLKKIMHVHWFDRPYTGWLHRNDSKASIANGVTPEGFIGYAVNMVDLDINYLQIMTASGFG